MTTLKPLGFFSDVVLGFDTAPTLRDSIRDVPQPDESHLVRYLEAGVDAGIAPVHVHDVLAEGEPFLGSMKLYTDGVWIWRSDLIHYVESYHCELPDAFVSHARGRGWVPPTSGEVNLDASADQPGARVDEDGSSDA